MKQKLNLNLTHSTQVQSDGALLIVSAANSDNTLFTCIGTNGFNSAPMDIEVLVARK